MSLDRRSFLKLTALGAGAAATGVSLSGSAFAEAVGVDPAAVFQYGVAAGDPLPDGLLLWTRVTPDPSASPGSGRGARTPVRWLVATDPRLKKVVRSGSVRTDPARDHTVKVAVDRLEPGTTYYYGFEAEGRLSRVGRARTAPAPGSTPERLRLGLVSCSNYAAGFFGGYRYLAQRRDLDLVLHVGDYIYEYGDGEYGSLRPLDPSDEIVSLEDYRRRHALHKADPDLSALHAAAAWVTTIDDHEVTNDTWREGAQNHQADAEGDFRARRRAAYQAYLEWMPVRETTEVDGEPRLYRTLRFGTLADLVVLDLRSYRDLQLQSPQPYAEAANPARTMLGAAQKSFLESELARPARWKLVANSVQMMTVNYPAGFYPTGNGTFRNVDAWDGYTAERTAVLTRAASASADTVFLTGDIHSTWAADLPVGGRSVATEFVCTSVTSDNLNEILSLPPRSPASLRFEQGVRALSPDVRLLEFDSHGASVVDVTADRVQCDWFYVSDRTDPAATISAAYSAQTVHGSRRVTPVLPLYAPAPVADDVEPDQHEGKAPKPQPKSLRV